MAIPHKVPFCWDLFRSRVNCLFISAAIAFSVLSDGACADESPVCSSGICSFHVPAEQMTAPCSHLTGLVVYSQSTGATLIQCSDQVTGATTVYITDRHGNSGGYEIEDGRYYRSQYLPELMKEGVPDRFGRVPLCDPNQRKKSTSFIVLEKEPADTDVNPYCYRIYYIDASATSLHVTRDDGYKVPPASKRTIAKWATLRRKLTALIKP